MRAVRQNHDEVGFSRRPVLDPDDLQLLATEGMLRMRDDDRFTTVSCEQGGVLRTLLGSKVVLRKRRGGLLCVAAGIVGWHERTCSSYWWQLR